MRIVNQSVFVTWCANSSFFKAIVKGFRHSKIIGWFKQENNRSIGYMEGSRFFRSYVDHARSLKHFKSEKPLLSGIKLSSWLEGSYFVNLIWTWKDCEDDDRNT